MLCWKATLKGKSLPLETSSGNSYDMKTEKSRKQRTQKQMKRKNDKETGKI
jgi:hypothetical protein